MSHDVPADAVEVAGASKRYGEAVALDGLDLVVGAGELVVLLGPSGSGKSTLLRSIAGIERLDHGTIGLGGRLVARGRAGLPPERRDLAMVFQDYALWHNLTVVENLRHALGRRRLDDAGATRRCLEILARAGMSRHANALPGALSGGEQQRVALARALVAEPALLLLDEPLSHLDASLRDDLRIETARVVRESGATCIYITHDQREGFSLADRVGVLASGRLLQVDAPEAVYRRPTTPFVAAFGGIAGRFEAEVCGPPGPDGQVPLRPRGTATTLTGRWCGPARTPGRRATVLVRPEAVALGAAVSTLPGVVRDVSFRGDHYEHAVDLEIGIDLVGVAARDRLERGRNVAVGFAPPGCLAYSSSNEHSPTLGSGGRRGP